MRLSELSPGLEKGWHPLTSHTRPHSSGEGLHAIPQEAQREPGFPCSGEMAHPGPLRGTYYSQSAALLLGDDRRRRRGRGRQHREAGRRWAPGLARVPGSSPGSNSELLSLPRPHTPYMCTHATHTTHAYHTCTYTHHTHTCHVCAHM